MATMTMVSLSDPLTPYHPPEMIASAIVRPRPDERPDCASFAVLPEEIIIKILEWCDFKGVLACQLVREACLPLIPWMNPASPTHLPTLTRRHAAPSET